MVYAPPSIDIKQLGVLSGFGLLDGFLRGFLEQGVGRAASPILAAASGIPYLLVEYLPQAAGFKASDAGKWVNNLTASMLISEISEMGSWATGPAATFLGEKTFGLGGAAAFESKVKSWSADAKAKLQNLMSNIRARLGGKRKETETEPSFQSSQQPSIVIEPEIPKRRRLLAPTRG